MENSRMGDIANAFKQTFADGPSSEPQQVDKASARMLGVLIEAANDGAAAGEKRGPTIASLGPGDRVNQPAQVTSGGDKGEYYWNGSAWIRTGDLFDPTAVQASITTVQDGLEDVNATVEATLPTSPSAPTLVPIVVADGQPVAWVDQNGFNAAGLTERMEAQIRSVLPFEKTSSIVPLVRAGDQMVMWLSSNGIEFAGPSNETSAEPRHSPRSAKAPIATDGRSLTRLRAKKARIGKNIAGSKLKVGAIGDSWAELNTLPIELRAILDDKYTLCGLGFRSAPAGNRISADEIYETTGWTFVDGGGTSIFPYGAGPDGQNIYASGTSATINWTVPQATDISFYTRGYGGTWGYRVDGGPRTIVNEANDAALKITAIAGLSDSQHVINIDTLGNAGVVSYCGAYATRNVVGAEVLKMGNGGTTGFRVNAYTQYMSEFFAHMNLDVLICMLGTNDYSSAASPPSVYQQAIRQITAAARAAVPDIGLIFVIPPRSNGDAVVPLSAYRDILYEECISSGTEFYNAHDDWPTWSVGNSHGLWTDDRHLSSPGGAVLMDSIARRFNFL